MIEDLIDKKNDKNNRIIDQLVKLIKDFDIKNEEDLKELEEKFFMVDGQSIDKLGFCTNKMYHDDYIFEFMDIEEIEEMEKLKDLCNSENDEEKKLYYIIKMFDMAGYDLYLPYTAYKYIISEKL